MDPVKPRKKPGRPKVIMDRKAYMKVKNAERRQRNREAGLCHDCSLPTGGTYRCADCSRVINLKRRVRQIR